MVSIRTIVLFFVLAIVASCTPANELSEAKQTESVSSYNTEVVTMKLVSLAFTHNSTIPSKYTCDGAGRSPPLSISDVPSGTKSLVLLMDDPDIPDFVKQKFNITVWDHWVLFNINPQTTMIAENSVPRGALQGKNTGGKNAYSGPCPPDREHRYFFKLYALDTLLKLTEGSTKKQVEDAMSGHVIAEMVLVGKYERK